MKEENDGLDIKGTIKKFVQAEEPELEQEEAIMKYGEEPTKKKKNKKNNNNDNEDSVEGNTEEQEHLMRLKQELLASLKRVEAMAKRVFEGNPLEEKTKINVKVDKASGGKTKTKDEDKEQDIVAESKKEKSQKSKAKERE